MKITGSKFKFWLLLALIATLSNTGLCVTSGDCCGCTDSTDCCSFCEKCNFCHYGKTWFSQRDQGATEYSVMSLTADKRHQYGREELYGNCAVTVGWQQNWEHYRLSSYFFNRSGAMTVGANSTNAEPYEDINVRASDLGLSTTFSGRAWLCPHYADFIADFDLYLGWDKLIQGLWTELRIPCVYTRWNAGLGSKPYAAGSTNYCTPDGTDCVFFNNRTVAGNDDIVVYRGDCALTNALKGDCGFDDAPCLSAGKIDTCTHTAYGLGGIYVTLGYDFLRRERGSCGLAVDVAFPAWNKPGTCNNTLYLFEANIGTQHCWKVGGVARGQCLLWAHDENEQRIDLYVDARASGAFAGKTTRLIGLQAGGTTLFNQYLLEKKYSITGDAINYEGLERAANLLKQQVSVRTTQAQITAMVQYQRGGLIGAAGYNFFGRSAEKLCPCNTCTDNYYYVIKGPASVGPDEDHDG